MKRLLSKWGLLLLGYSLTLASTAGSESPNIVMIVADDQTFRDFGFMGNALVETPHLDRLASKSARYVNGYVPTSVCRPSLVTLLTGLYPHEHGVHFNHGPPGNSGYNRMTSREVYEAMRASEFELIRKVPTLPRLLGEKGYRSLQTGKFWEGHFSNAGFTEGMTVFKPVPGQNFGGNRKLASGEIAAHGNGDAGLKIGRETMAPIEEFIDAAVAAEDPFFVWYAPYLPHEPHDSPEEYYDLYRGRSEVPKHAIPYYASCSQFDDTVGELVEMVESRGLAEDTIFVFVIDNGWTPERTPSKRDPERFLHTKESKRSPFEDGLRTPILIRWDGVVKAVTHEELVNSIDIVPTVLRAAGVEMEDLEMPGIDLMPSARGEARLDGERAVFGGIYPGDATSLDNPGRDIAYRWVRRGNMKLITCHGADEEGRYWGDYLRGDALYDLATDPREKKNLIEDPGRAEVVADLRARLDSWWKP